jgi:hypothetical protein
VPSVEEMAECQQAKIRFGGTRIQEKLSDAEKNQLPMTPIYFHAPSL